MQQTFAIVGNLRFCCLDNHNPRRYICSKIGTDSEGRAIIRRVESDKFKIAFCPKSLSPY